MTDEMIALGRRARACKGFRWLPGMRWIVTRVAPLEDYAGRIVDGGRRAPDGPGLPDFSDPATLGCLLALVRVAWRSPTVYVRQSTTRRVSDGVIAWEVCDLWLDAEARRALGVPREGSVGCWGYANEAEALVVALEGAP
jgi:hypothetical protein